MTRLRRRPDVRLLFATRAVRTFAYGLLGVILALYLAARGFDDAQIGLLFTLTLAGDAALTLTIAALADRLGRRRVLVVSCAFVVFAGVAFAMTGNMLLLTIAAVLGTISPSGAEVGPFLSIEQAAISQEIPASDRTRIFGFYQLTGSLSNALGALGGGWFARLLTVRLHSELDAFRAIIVAYAALGVVLALLFVQLSSVIEPKPAKRVQTRTGLHRSRNAIIKLAALFTVDSFGSGLAVQTLLAYWLHRRFDADLGTLGTIFFATNTMAGLSALVSARIANRFGLVNTMVWTHLPGNLLLIAFPFMPTLELSVAALLGRFLVAQMDVPARTSYLMAIVDDDERSAASAVTNQAKLIGTSLGPVVAGVLGVSALPFVLAGILKIAYDISLYRLFSGLRPPEERGASDARPSARC